MTNKAITNIPGFTELLGPSDAIDDVANAYARVPLIFRAVRLRCDSLSQVPFKIMSGKTEKEWPFESDLTELLWMTQAALLMTGGAYWLRLANATRQGLGMAPQNVIWLNPTSVVVDYENGEHRFKQQAGTVTNGPWGLDEIVYLREFDLSQDTQPGIGAAMVALGDAQLANYAVRLSGKYFESGAMPALLLGLSNTNEQERKRVESWFSRRLGGLQSGVRKVLGLTTLPSIHELTPNIKEMVIPELYDMAKMNVATAFGIPPSMLEDPAANRATATEHRISFWADTVRPDGDRMMQQLNRQLLEPMGLELVFNWDEMDVFQEDEEQRAGSLEALSRAWTIADSAPVFLALAASLGYDFDEEIVEKLNGVEVAREERRQEFTQRFQPDQLVAERAINYDMAKELATWERHAKGRLKKNGKATSDFKSDLLPAVTRGAILGALEEATTPAQVEAVFKSVWSGYP